MEVMPLLILLALAPALLAEEDVGQIYDDAKRLAAEGNYALALEMHVQFHEKSRDIPRHAGVRLTFAISDWVKLGKKYPPAMDRLRQLRDEKVARLLAGETDRLLFSEVQRINDRLDTPSETVALFKTLDEKNPEFAAEIYDQAEESLIDAGEYQLALKYIGDPVARIAEIHRRYETVISLNDRLPEESRDSDRAIYENIYSDKVIRLITLVSKSGDGDLAKKLQAEALEFLDTPQIRAALGEDE